MKIGVILATFQESVLKKIEYYWRAKTPSNPRPQAPRSLTLATLINHLSPMLADSRGTDTFETGDIKDCRLWSRAESKMVRTMLGMHFLYFCVNRYCTDTQAVAKVWERKSSANNEIYLAKGKGFSKW